jgi:hypothetical protein
MPPTPKTVFEIVKLRIEPFVWNSVKTHAVFAFGTTSSSEFDTDVGRWVSISFCRAHIALRYTSSACCGLRFQEIVSPLKAEEEL